MEKKNKKKYLIAVYLSVALIAIICGLIAFYWTKDPFFQALLLNFSTELFGVVFIFALVNYFFLIEEWDLSENVSKLISLLNNKKEVKAKDFFSSESISHNIPNEVFINAKSIYLVGYSLSRVTRKNMGLFTKLIENGTTIRFIILDPKIESVIEQITARTTDNLTKKLWKQRLKNAISLINALKNVPETRGAVEIGYLPFLPGFGMVIINPIHDNPECYTLIYPHRSVEMEPSFKISPKEDPYWYNFFLNQYEVFWENCRK